MTRPRTRTRRKLTDLSRKTRSARRIHKWRQLEAWKRDWEWRLRMTEEEKHPDSLALFSGLGPSVSWAAMHFLEVSNVKQETASPDFEPTDAVQSEQDYPSETFSMHETLNNTPVVTVKVEFETEEEIRTQSYEPNKETQTKGLNEYIQVKLELFDNDVT